MRKFSRSLLTGVVLLTAARVSAAAVAVEPRLEMVWEHRFRSGSDVNAAYAVAVGRDGSVFVAGDVGSGADWLVLRLDPTGRETWRFDFATPNIEIPAAIALTAAGDVIAAGVQSGLERDFLAIMLSARGAERRRFGSQSGGDQTWSAVAADKSGNLYLAGESTGHWDLRRFGADGRERWSRPGPVGAARAVAVRGDDEVIAAGHDADGWRVVGLDRDGAARWRLDGLPAAPRAMARALTIADDGSVYVAGSWHADTRQTRVVKIAPSHGISWTYVDAGGVPLPHAMTTLRDGTVVVVGETNEDWFMLGLAPDGSPRWRFTHDGGGRMPIPDQAFGVAAHPDGGFVVCGLVHPTPPSRPLRGLVDWRIAHYRVHPGRSASPSQR